jgi:hypothetical protein
VALAFASFGALCVFATTLGSFGAGRGLAAFAGFGAFFETLSTVFFEAFFAVFEAFLAGFFEGFLAAFFAAFFVFAVFLAPRAALTAFFAVFFTAAFFLRLATTDSLNRSDAMWGETEAERLLS